MNFALNRTCRIAGILILLSVVLTCSKTQAQAPDLNWSPDGSRCWFKLQSENGQDSYWIINALEKTKELAFDTGAMQQAIMDVAGSKSVNIQSIDFGHLKNQLILKTQNSNYILNRESGTVKETKTTTIGPTLFLHPKPGANGPETEISLENQTDKDIQLFWIDGSEAEHNYGTIVPGETRKQHTFVGHIWSLKIDDQSKGYFRAEKDGQILIDDEYLSSIKPNSRDRDPRKRFNFIKRRLAHFRSNALMSPDKKHRVAIETLSATVSTQDPTIETAINAKASPGYSLSANHVFWSPDARSVAFFETKNVQTRKVHYVESSPKQSLQPKLRDYNYPKPGDDLPVRRLRLFSLDSKKEIEVDHRTFDNPFWLRFVGWSKDAEKFWLLYNQRGHQALRLIEVNSKTGETRTVVDENSDTFIHYSDAGKSLFEPLTDSQFLWSSERTGWNHLYRYSTKTGELLNQVTAGNWNFHRLDHIDFENQVIWFYAIGVLPDQDPYHKHFCRINFDGSNFRVLTAGDGTHEISYEQRGKYLVDVYSRVDLAPVVELRESHSGELVCEISREDTTKRFGSRRLTERFVAKGRDGQTDIWGIIHWPINFDEEKKYPVIENIYAGPHDFHVPKRFRRRFYHQHAIADAGFIVVQIDGMGTAWRSKAFHDVCYKNLKDAGFPDRIAWMKAAAGNFPQLDLNRVGIYGGSAGGQNAMAALLWHHDFYDVAVADCGCHDNRMDKIWWNEQWMGWPVDESYIQNSNTANAQLLKGHLMLTLGELDRNVDPASTVQVVHELIKHDKDFEFVLVAGKGHGAGESAWAAKKRLNFFKRHLQTGKP